MSARRPLRQIETPAPSAAGWRERRPAFQIPANDNRRGVDWRGVAWGLWGLWGLGVAAAAAVIAGAGF